MRRTRWSRSRRSRSLLPALVTLAAIAAITLVASLIFPPEPSLSGRAYVVDGDTLRIDGTRIRLVGLDAVELDQTCRSEDGRQWPCGQEARLAVSDLVGAGAIVCSSEGQDRYRRVLARCAVRSKDLGEAIVRAGWAVADLEYALALADARLNRRGIWDGNFDEPSAWRRDHGEPFDFWTWLAGWFGH